MCQIKTLENDSNTVEFTQWQQPMDGAITPSVCQA